METDTLSTEQAVETLSEADWYRLRQASRFYAWKLRELDADELLAEAVLRTLDGRRRWRPEATDVIGHLVGAMRSIASHDRVKLPKDGTPSRLPRPGHEDPERALAARKRLESVFTYFEARGDSEVLRVLDAMKLGDKGPAIRKRLGLTQRALETIMRRIRRGAQRVAVARGGLS